VLAEILEHGDEIGTLHCDGREDRVATSRRQQLKFHV